MAQDAGALITTMSIVMLADSRCGRAEVKMEGKGERLRD